MTDDQLASTVSAYVSLAAQMHAEYDSRRSLEWKMHIAVWTLLAASAYSIGYLHLIVPVIYLLPWLGFMLGLHLIWCVKIQQGQRVEQDLSRLYRSRAENLLCQAIEEANLSPAETRIEEIPGSGWLRERFKNYNWWLFAELGTTLCISCVVLGTALFATPKATADSSIQNDLTVLRTTVTSLQANVSDLHRQISELSSHFRQQPAGNEPSRLAEKLPKKR